jgi:DNA-binding response OmpR family regulator
MSARVVVADDSRTMLALLTLAVRRSGHEPATATDGGEALALVREHRPELLILDAVMPGLSGYDVCRSVRDEADGPQPHVIMLTAGGQDADRLRAEEAGVDEFMTKPFSPSTLGARVRDLLGGS